MQLAFRFHLLFGDFKAFLLYEDCVRKVLFTVPSKGRGGGSRGKFPGPGSHEGLKLANAKNVIIIDFAF